MAADEFSTIATGTSLQNAFSISVDNASYEYGHGGYTGTIAEKNSVVEIDTGSTRMTEPRARKFAEAMLMWGFLTPAEQAKVQTKYAKFDIDRALTLVADKWGPAAAIKINRKTFLFFGLASS